MQLFIVTHTHTGSIYYCPLCLFKVKDEKEDYPEEGDEETTVDDPAEEMSSEDELLKHNADCDDENGDAFNSLSQLADISLAAEGKLKDLALSERIRY